MGTKKLIKVGVIGYGGAFNMGKHHLVEAAQAGMVPAAVSDLDPKRLETAEEDFPGIGTYTSVAEMLKKSDADLITVITPHNTHAKLAVQCLNAGRHVVVEKPFAITTAECDRMISAAEKKKLVLSTYHNRHWDGCILQALKVIGKGKIGDVVRIEAHMGRWGKPREWWRSSRTISGGILYDWGVHILEYSLQIMDSEITEVSGFSKSGFWADRTKWKADTNEDEAAAIIRFKSGGYVNLCMSSVDSNPKTGQLEITGTKGSYILDGRTWETIIPKKGSTVREQGTNPESEGWRFYQNVADHLIKGEKLVITPQWARRPVHILDLAVKSAASGKALAAKYR
ncbi:MAG: Gfo/Idh/MocA family oxidoreductase [Spirochaetales bacterium]|nr:Gfo/Idh/MocA family oxidoreductase [Spirochaetales bacterium]